MFANQAQSPDAAFRNQHAMRNPLPKKPVEGKHRMPPSRLSARRAAVNYKRLHRDGERARASSLSVERVPNRQALKPQSRREWQNHGWQIAILSLQKAY